MMSNGRHCTEYGTTIQPSLLVQVLEVPNANGSLGYRLQLVCLRGKLKILKSFFACIILTTSKVPTQPTALPDQQSWTSSCTRQGRMMVLGWKRDYMDDFLDCFDDSCITDKMSIVSFIGLGVSYSSDWPYHHHVVFTPQYHTYWWRWHWYYRDLSMVQAECMTICATRASAVLPGEVFCFKVPKIVTLHRTKNSTVGYYVNFR